MTQQLRHTLKNRHIQMIALGGAIGTGLFLGSASAILITGPSIVFAYIIGGLIIYGVMRALGEMTVDHPCPGAFMEYARQNLGQGAGFVAGWNTWLLFTIVCMTEASATGVLLDYWIYIPHWITAMVVLSIFGGLNLISVKNFGEAEFWFAGIKVVVILLMIIAGIYLICGDSIVQNIVKTNLHTYKSSNVFFSSGASGFILSLAMVVLSFGGCEFVSVAAGEAENPQKSIPKAINGVVVRIILFYVLTIAIIILIYPFHELNAKSSPFTNVFSNLGFRKAADLINFVAMTATLSSLNSCLYVASRFLFSMAGNNLSSPGFAKINKSHVPSRAVIFTIIIAFGVVIANYVFPAQIMSCLFSLVSVGFIINWYIILLSHLMFRKRKDLRGETILYKMPGYPYINILIMSILFIIMMAMSKDPNMSMSIYAAPAWVFILSIIHALRSRNKVKAKNQLV